MTMRLHSGICSGFMTRIIQAHHVNLDELLRHQRISTIVRANEPAGVMCLPTVAVQKPFPTPKTLKHLVGWFFCDTLANIYIYIIIYIYNIYYYYYYGQLGSSSHIWTYKVLETISQLSQFPYTKQPQ